MAIGKRIVERLEQLKLPRQYLFDSIPDLTPQALSNLIKRDSKRSEWDEKIAAALQVSVLWLVYGKETEYPTPATSTQFQAAEPIPFESEKALKVRTILRQLNDQRQSEVLSFAEERLVLQRAGDMGSTKRAGQ